MNFDGSGKTKLMHPYKVHGYLRIRIFRNGNCSSVGVHRLVAGAFLPNPKNLTIVNHLDGNKANNIATNLEWCTQSQNSCHAYRVLGCKASGGKPKRKVTCLDNAKVYSSVKQASVDSGINRTSIISCCKGRYTTAGGLHWAYA